MTMWSDRSPDAALGGAAPVADTTANLPQWTLRLLPGRVPADTSGVITVTYAKQPLTPAGSSIPERRHDVVLLGAAAYALLAYQVGTNDLFR